MESQNIGSWKGPLDVIYFNSLLKQGHLEKGAQDYEGQFTKGLSVFLNHITIFVG